MCIVVRSLLLFFFLWGQRIIIKTLEASSFGTSRRSWETGEVGTLADIWAAGSHFGFMKQSPAGLNVEFDLNCFISDRGVCILLLNAFIVYVKRWLWRDLAIFAKFLSRNFLQIFLRFYSYFWGWSTPLYLIEAGYERKVASLHFT